MITEVNVPLNCILANPWQPRESEDLEHIKALALDIAAHGLLQKPVGRLIRPIGDDPKTYDSWEDNFSEFGFRVQLAFGHSRLAAFKWLNDVQNNSNLEGDWSRMPVILQELSDQQMFEMAVSENLQRRDLTPIEVAKAMARYRSEFGKTSSEIGTLFGISASAVRNKMRLVELPEVAQEALENSRITENAARRLLTLKDTLPDKAISEIAVELAGKEFDKPEQADWFIVDKITKEPRSKRLFYSSHSNGEKATAGEGMWPLDWQVPEDRKEPTPGQVGQMLKDPSLARQLRSNIEQTLRFYTSAHEAEAKKVGDPEVIAAVDHLVHLPTCSACKFFLKVNGGGFCGRKACWEYKRRLWIQAELQRLSAELGIPIYNPAEDGDVYEPLGRYGMGDRDKKIVEMHKRQSGYLRLNAIKDLTYMWGRNPITNHQFVQVISISDESCAYMRQSSNEKDRRDALEKAEQDNRERGWRMQKLSRDFIERVAAKEFGEVMFPLKPGTLALLFRVWGRETLPDDLDGNEKNHRIRVRLGYQVIDALATFDIERQGPVAMAEYLQGTAKEIGLDLPENWLDMAREIENGVSAETEGDA